MKTTSREVCTACGAVWFVAPGGRCQSCKGTTVKDDDCVELDSGEVWHKKLRDPETKQLRADPRV